jgi:ubiquinone/menaquinone biosynthesis methyltransferase
VTIGFGLRNVTDKDAALKSLYRVTKPGGRLLVLEFSHAHLGALAPLYEIYSFQLLPRLGEWLAGDAASYRYLAESIRRHPDQEMLKTMMERAGFERCEYFNLAAGIVALHVTTALKPLEDELNRCIGESTAARELLARARRHKLRRARRRFGRDGRAALGR